MGEQRWSSSAIRTATFEQQRYSDGYVRTTTLFGRARNEKIPQPVDVGSPRKLAQHTPNSESFNGYRFSKVSWLIDVGSPPHGSVVGQ